MPIDILADLAGQGHQNVDLPLVGPESNPQYVDPNMSTGPTIQNLGPTKENLSELIANQEGYVGLGPPNTEYNQTEYDKRMAKKEKAEQDRIGFMSFGGASPSKPPSNEFNFAPRKAYDLPLDPDIHERNRQLQYHYGDSSTIKVRRNKHWPEMIEGVEYDVDELERRHNIAKTGGLEAEPTWNPLVHLGKSMVDTHHGIKQILGRVTPEEEEAYQYDNALYNTANQPLASQIGGELMLGATGFAGAPGRMFLGHLLKKSGDTAFRGGMNLRIGQEASKSMNPSAYREIAENSLKISGSPTGDIVRSVFSQPRVGGNIAEKATDVGVNVANKVSNVGEYLKRSSAYSGSTTGLSPHSLFPGGISAIEGGALMGVQPVNQELTPYEQTVQRLSNAAAGLGLGGFFGLSGNFATGLGQKYITHGMRREFQNSLPHPVELPTAHLYDQRGVVRAIQNRSQSSSRGFGPESAARQVNAYEDSVQKNFKAMNLNMSGSSNETIGKSIAPILHEYKVRRDAAKQAVTDAYDNVKFDMRPVYGHVDDYKKMLNRVDNKIKRYGLHSNELAQSSLNAMRANVDPIITPNSNGFFDAHDLMNTFRSLNNKQKAAGKNKEVRQAIGQAKEELRTFMTGPNFWGASDKFDKYFNAVDAAKKQFDEFESDKTIAQYYNWADGLENGKSPEDISRSIFGHKSLDKNAGPKARSLQKLIDAFGEDSNVVKSFKNEAIANLVHDLADSRGALNEINVNLRRTISSGINDDIYKKIFSKEELQQFHDLTRAMNAFDFPEMHGEHPISSAFNMDLSPLSLISKITPALNDSIVMARSGGNRIAPNADVFNLGRTVPMIAHTASGAETHGSVPTLPEFILNPTQDTSINRDETRPKLPKADRDAWAQNIVDRMVANIVNKLYGSD
jgi:hypothetical protein